MLSNFNIKYLGFLSFLKHLVFLGLALVFSTRIVQGATLWKEEFDGELRASEWHKIDEYGYLEFTTTTALLQAPSGRIFPYLYTTSPVFPQEGDYSTKIRLKYMVKDYNFGAGLVLDNTVYEERINYSPPASSGVFKIWPLPGKRIGIKSNIPSDGIHPENCTSGCFFYVQNIDEASPWLEIVIHYNHLTSQYSVAVNENKEVFISAPTSKKLQFVWIGNPEVTQTVVEWPKFQVDYIHIISSQYQPIILLPGLGASWNTRAMVYNQKVELSEWRKTPFVNIYDGLIQSLQQNGWQENQNFFVFWYDWRKPIAQIASDLDTFIQQNPTLASADKISLVGHSLGGLVARAWAQTHPEKLKTLITVGSPHRGALQAYKAVSGGELGEAPDLGWLAWQILIALYRPGFRTTAEAIKEIAPVVKDLVPIFDFLKYRQRPINWQTIQATNQYLADLWQQKDVLTNKIIFLTGNQSESTPEWYLLKKRSIFDEILGLWPEGRIYQTLYGKGDETVLAKSATWEEAATISLNLNHRQLIAAPEGIEAILTQLGINTPSITTVDPYPQDNLLVAYLASPAKLRVFWQQQEFHPVSDEEQFVIIPEPPAGDYRLQIKGTGNGDYHLVLLYSGPQGITVQTWQNQITPNQAQEYQLQLQPNAPSPLKLIDESGLTLLSLASFVLKQAGLTQFLSDIQTIQTQIENQNWQEAQQNLKNLLSQISRWRRQNPTEINKRNLTFIADEYLCQAWEKILKQTDNIPSRVQRRWQRRALAYHRIAQRLFTWRKRRGRTPSLAAAETYQKASKLTSKIKQSYPTAWYSWLLFREALTTR